MSNLTDTQIAIKKVLAAGHWKHFTQTLVMDMADQLDIISDDKDLAVFWSLTSKAIDTSTTDDTALNILEYLAGVPNFVDYVNEYLVQRESPNLDEA